MTQYYYLVSGLPEISFDDNRALPPFREVLAGLVSSLSKTDAARLNLLLSDVDNRNLINLLENSGRPFDSEGNYSEEMLHHAIKTRDGVPGYLIDFITAFQTGKPIFDGLARETELAWLHADYMTAEGDPFISSWALFDRNLKNAVTALNCRRFNRPVETQVIGSDETSERFRKSAAPDFGLSAELPWLTRLLSLPFDDPVETEKRLDQLRWQVLDDMTAFSYFDGDRVLAFALKLRMALRWKKLDAATGRALFTKLLDETRQSTQTLIA